MTAALVAQTLGLSEDAVDAFSGTPQQFAQHFGKSVREGEWAIGQIATTPAAPTTINAFVASTTQVNVGYILVDDGGSPVTSVIIESVPSIALTYDQADIATPTPVTGTFAKGVAYRFTVKAVNAVGPSVVSNQSQALTPNP